MTIKNKNCIRQNLIKHLLTVTKRKVADQYPRIIQINKNTAGNERKSFPLHCCGNDGALSNMYSAVHDFLTGGDVSAAGGLACRVW
jgi:hypothetical protein